MTLTEIIDTFKTKLNPLKIYGFARKNGEISTISKFRKMIQGRI